MADIEEWRSVVQDANAASQVPHDTDGFRSVDIDALRSGFSPEPTSHFPDYVADSHEQGAEPAPEDKIKMPSWPPDDPSPQPSPEHLMETVQARLLSHPQKPLEIRYIPMLGYIFEGYRNLREDREKLEHLLREETQRFLNLEKQYENEIHLLKIDKKELEIVVAHDNGGVATMRLARENSSLRRRVQGAIDEYDHDATCNDSNDTCEEGEAAGTQEEVTAQEFLEKSRRSEDQSWASRKDAHRRSLSPSFHMQLLSKKLSEDETVYPGLPDGTVPMRGPSTLAQASLLQRHLESTDSDDPARVMLPPGFQADEPSRLLAARAMAKKSMMNLKEHLAASEAKTNGEDEDVKAIKRMAKTISKRRGLNMEVVLPKLLDVFSISTETDHKGNTSRDEHLTPVTTGKTQSTQNFHVPVSSKKAPGLKAKASGLLQKLKPQPSREAITTPTTPGQRFSFERGDDGANRPEPYGRSSPNASGISDKAGKRDGHQYKTERFPGNAAPALTQATFSPIAPVSGDGRKPTRIPTPTYNTGPYAQPRREREDSLSSLLTAMRYPTTSPMHQEGTLSEFTGSMPSPETSSNVDASPLANKHRQTRKHSLMDHTNSLAHNTSAGGDQCERTMRSQSLHMAPLQARVESGTRNRGNAQRSTHFPILMSYYNEATEEEYKPSTADEFSFTG